MSIVRVRKRKLEWDPSTDSSAVSQSVYVAKGLELTEESLNNPVLTDLPMDVSSLDIPDDIPGFDFSEEGTYTFGIGTVDEVGNETIEVISGPLDFSAPRGATNLRLL